MSSTPSSSRKRPALPRTSSWRSITESTVARIDHLFRPSAAQDLAPAENSTGEHAIDHQDTGKASSVLPSPPHPRSLSAPQSISQSYSTTFPMSSGRGTEGGNNIGWLPFPADSHPLTRRKRVRRMAAITILPGPPTGWRSEKTFLQPDPPLPAIPLPSRKPARGAAMASRPVRAVAVKLNRRTFLLNASHNPKPFRRTWPPA